MGAVLGDLLSTLCHTGAAGLGGRCWCVQGENTWSVSLWVVVISVLLLLSSLSQQWPFVCGSLSETAAWNRGHLVVIFFRAGTP